MKSVKHQPKLSCSISGNYLYSKAGFEADMDIKAIIIFDGKSLLQRVMQQSHASR